MQPIVGILRGGPSREHEVSLHSGAALLANLPEERYTAHDIYIDKKGIWHDRGRVSTPEKIIRQLDVALIGLHGAYGEDGEVQKLLERFGVPYTGSTSFASYLAMHKLLAKVHARDAGILVPDFRHIEHAEGSDIIVRDVIRSFPQPVVVKPIDWGSSIGVSVVGGYAAVQQAVQDLFEAGASGVLVEEYIRGTEAAVGVIESFRGDGLYTLPPLEILLPDGSHLSFEARSSGNVEHACPGSFSRYASEDLQHTAKLLHRALGLRHYSQSDFIVTPRGIYYLETDALPTLTEDALFSRGLAAVGIPLSEFSAHLVNLALVR